MKIKFLTFDREYKTKLETKHLFYFGETESIGEQDLCKNYCRFEIYLATVLA